ncbi:MAG TPA: hypothetical protein VMW64_00820 [Dehalococcoidia bacterium]|nr:hypothetical protein [Dehalococcoidia bacterium]
MNGEESPKKGKKLTLGDLGIKIEQAKLQLGPLKITIEDTGAQAEPDKKEKLESERDKLLERLREIDKELKGENPQS